MVARMTFVKSEWTDAYTRASCAHCKWTTDAGDLTQVQGAAIAHVNDHPDHIVAIDHGQTRYVRGA